MKNKVKLILGVLLLLLSTNALVAQKKAVNEKVNMQAEEEEVIYLLKFEPNFLATEAKRSARIKLMKERIDAMDISKVKRRKLIVDLYRSKTTKRLTTVLLTDTKFEDDED